MFVQSEKFVRSHQGNVKDLSIFGQESNPTTLRLARMNLAIRGIDARLEDGLEEVFLIEPGEGGRDITGAPGDRISLLPWGDPAAGVRTSGLYYPLRGETLYPERTRGISNVMVEQHAHVSLETGRLICIHTRTESPIIHSEKESVR